jgi:hypothetical protein
VLAALELESSHIVATMNGWEIVWSSPIGSAASS